MHESIFFDIKYHKPLRQRLLHLQIQLNYEYYQLIIELIIFPDVQFAQREFTLRRLINFHSFHHKL